MAKRRLNPDEIRAAVEAGPPPHSVNYETDKQWHAEQNRWLAKWTVSCVLRILSDFCG